jgi:hypothetical protein
MVKLILAIAFASSTQICLGQSQYQWTQGPSEGLGRTQSTRLDFQSDLGTTSAYRLPRRASAYEGVSPRNRSHLLPLPWLQRVRGRILGTRVEVLQLLPDGSQLCRIVLETDSYQDPPSNTCDPGAGLTEPAFAPEPCPGGYCPVPLE